MPPGADKSFVSPEFSEETQVPGVSGQVTAPPPALRTNIPVGTRVVKGRYGVHVQSGVRHLPRFCGLHGNNSDQDKDTTKNG